MHNLHKFWINTFQVCVVAFSIFHFTFLQAIFCFVHFKATGSLLLVSAKLQLCLCVKLAAALMFDFRLNVNQITPRMIISKIFNCRVSKNFQLLYRQQRALGCSPWSKLFGGDPNFYEILGVEKNATQSEIRKAFIEKSKTVSIWRYCID